jgi:two-component sensor histidine kinase/sensor domain CHASE-containing protein
MFENRPFLSAVFIFILSLGFGSFLIYLLESKREVESRAIATLIATSHAKSLEKQLSRSLSATYALASILKQNKSIPNFDSLAKDLIDRYGGITNLQLSPKAIVSQIFPLEGHQRAIGHDISKNPYAIAAIQSKQLTLEGPIELIQGGVAVLGRYPVFLPNAKTGEAEFWGFTTALIELSKLLEAVDIHGLISKNYHFDLSRIDPETGKNVAFSKSRDTILENPVSVNIQIPNGEWVLSIVPKAGWHSYYYLMLEGLLVLFSCGALSYLGYRHFCKTNELRRYKESLETSLLEKELLLKEVHHRTKNNMQIISSLLWLQSKDITEKKYLQMFQDCSCRISAMALIHEQIYGSTDISKISFQQYLTSLGKDIFKSFGVAPDKIQLVINSNNIFLDLDSGIPCGILIQELISNSIKHAFPDEKRGIISIALRSLGERKLELIIGDNGVGLPQGLDFQNTSSLGLSLVSTLVRNQLGGAITLNKDQGTEFKIIFHTK